VAKKKRQGQKTLALKKKEKKTTPLLKAVDYQTSLEGDKQRTLPTNHEVYR